MGNNTIYCLERIPLMTIPNAQELFYLSGNIQQNSLLSSMFYNEAQMIIYCISSTLFSGQLLECSETQSK